jgi:hypothetical protein
MAEYRYTGATVRFLRVESQVARKGPCQRKVEMSPYSAK